MSSIDVTSYGARIPLKREIFQIMSELNNVQQPTLSSSLSKIGILSVLEGNKIVSGRRSESTRPRWRSWRHTFKSAGRLGVRYNVPAFLPLDALDFLAMGGTKT